MTTYRNQLAFLLLATTILSLGVLPGPVSGQLYSSSVVGTEIDFITDADPSCLMCIEFKGKGFREMPDKSDDKPLIGEAYIFMGYYSDGTEIDFAIDAGFENASQAETETQRYATRLGKLPTALRAGVKRVVVHQGKPDTTAFSDHGLIVMYSANATKRISTHDLEETLFHESVHASWDRAHSQSEGWTRAQAADGAFITNYARRKSKREDLAESALFAFTLIHHRDRIPKDVAKSIMTTIPARVRFVESLLPKDKPLTYSVGPKYACDGSGKTFVVSEERFQNAKSEFEKTAAKPPAANLQSSEITSCSIDLKKPGQMSDILSNALMLALNKEESKVASFLNSQRGKHSTGDELLAATAVHFEIERAVLEKKVVEFKHVNCQHDELKK